MVAASAVLGPCGRIAINTGEADESLMVILDTIIGIDIDVSGSLSGFSSNEVRVPVFYLGDTEMIKPTFL
jgi:hypothetical protein